MIFWTARLQDPFVTAADESAAYVFQGVRFVLVGVHEALHAGSVFQSHRFRGVVFRPAIQGCNPTCPRHQKPCTDFRSESNNRPNRPGLEA